MNLNKIEILKIILKLDFKFDDSNYFNPGKFGQKCRQHLQKPKIIKFQPQFDQKIPPRGAPEI